MKKKEVFSFLSLGVQIAGFAAIFFRLEKIMANVDDMKAALAEANTATNEIAADVQDLLNRVIAGGLTEAETQEVKSEVAALVARLQGVAAQHTPEGGGPVDPPVEGQSAKRSR